MRSSKLILALGAFFLLAAGLSACGSGVPGNAVADMAGNPITTAAFKHWMFVAAKGNAQTPGAPVIVPTDPPGFTQCLSQVRKQIPQLAQTPDKQIKSDCAQLFTSLSSQVMRFLIRAYWYQAEAAKQHLNVTDAQVQQEFATEKKAQFPTDAGFQGFLAQTGQTQQDILFLVRRTLIARKLVAKTTTSITSATIQSYYQAHSSQFGSPEARDLRIVRTSSSAQADAAKAALGKGQSWSAVASKYSIDPATKSKGGLLVGVTKGQEDQGLDQAAFSAPLNKVLGPVHGTFGFYVFEVTRIKAATQQTLAQATPAIQKLLQSQQQTNAQNAVDQQARKDWLRQTHCRSTYAMSDCSGYKAPKAPASTTPAPSTTTPPPSTTGSGSGTTPTPPSSTTTTSTTTR
jgi:foldase protein PrsA